MEILNTLSSRATPARVLGRRFLLAVSLLGATCATSPAAETMTDNAALYYWESFASMLKPRNADDFGAMTYIDDTLQTLPPRVLGANGDALRWLLSEKALTAGLDRAARQRLSAFPVYEKGIVTANLSHLAPLRDMTRRALAAAKATEYVGNAEASDGIYANLLRMIQHLDQDRSLYSCIAAAELMQMVLYDIEGFVSRHPEARALARMTRCFNDAPETIFHPGAAIRDERIRYTDWLLSDPSAVEKKLEILYGKAERRPAVEKLLTLDAKAKATRLEEWLAEYREWMDELAGAFEAPYAEGITLIQSSDARLKKLAQNANETPNPLIPLLVPETAPLYQRILLAEAQFDLADLLCIIAQYRADVGEWPASLVDIRPLRYRTLPKDPFTGKTMYYRRSLGYPVMLSRIPRWMASEKKYLFEIDIRARRTHDDRMADREMKFLRRQRINEMIEPVPMK